MPGAVVIVLVLVIVLPVLIMMTGPLIAGALGWSLKDDAEARNEGSELIELNR
jgi:hypothetical protein